MSDPSSILNKKPFQMDTNAKSIIKISARKEQRIKFRTEVLGLKNVATIVEEESNAII